MTCTTAFQSAILVTMNIRLVLLLCCCCCLLLPVMGFPQRVPWVVLEWDGPGPPPGKRNGWEIRACTTPAQNANCHMAPVAMLRPPARKYTAALPTDPTLWICFEVRKVVGDVRSPSAYALCVPPDGGAPLVR